MTYDVACCYRQGMSLKAAPSLLIMFQAFHAHTGLAYCCLGLCQRVGGVVSGQGQPGAGMPGKGLYSCGVAQFPPLPLTYGFALHLNVLDCRMHACFVACFLLAALALQPCTGAPPGPRSTTAYVVPSMQQDNPSNHSYKRFGSIVMNKEMLQQYDTVVLTSDYRVVVSLPRSLPALQWAAWSPPRLVPVRSCSGLTDDVTGAVC